MAVVLIWLIWRSREHGARSSLAFWLALVTHGYVFCFMGLKALPYVYYSQKSSKLDEHSQYLSGIWIDGWSSDDSPAHILAAAKKLNPELLLVAGSHLESLPKLLTDLGFAEVVQVDSVDNKSIFIASARPFSPEKVTNLGVNSWPGGVFSQSLSDGSEIQIGVITLERSLNQGRFERNRVTARRLSSIMRDSDKTRLVFGQFSATPFSQFVSVYSEQARMNSLMFGRGLAGTANIFASKNISSASVSSIEIPGRLGGAFWFKLAISSK